MQNMSGQRPLRGVAHAAKAGANAAPGFGNLFIAGASNALLEVNEARCGKDRMRMRINEARKYVLTRTIDLVDVLRFRCKEFVLCDFVGRADCGNLSIGDEYRAVFNDAAFAHLAPPVGAAVAGEGR